MSSYNHSLPHNVLSEEVSALAKIDVWILKISNERIQACLLVQPQHQLEIDVWSLKIPDVRIQSHSSSSHGINSEPENECCVQELECIKCTSSYLSMLLSNQGKIMNVFVQLWYYLDRCGGTSTRCRANPWRPAPETATAGCSPAFLEPNQRAWANKLTESAMAKRSYLA